MFINIFFLVVFNFFFFLYTAERMFSLKVKRRRNFPLRAAIAAVIAIAVMAGDTQLYLATGNAIWASYIMYGSVFATSIFIMQFIFDVSIKTTLYCCSAGYAAQNMGSKIHSLIYYNILGFMPAGVGYLLPLLLSMIIIHSVVYLILYLIFGKIINSYAAENKADSVSVAISFVTLIIVLFLSRLFDVYTERQSVLGYTTRIICIICCILILCLLSNISTKSRINDELDVIKLLWQMKEEEIENYKRNIDIINVKCYDLRHQMRALRHSSEEISRSSLKEIEQAINFYDANILTGNETLDVILTEHSLYCNQNHIRLDCMIEGEKLNFMSVADMYVLFGNAIENAVREVSKAAEEKRVIRFIGKSAMGLFTIQVENYCISPPELENGLPVTTKEDKNYHGFGIKSMKMIAEKYDGTMSVSCKDETFLLTFVFPEKNSQL